ncbi:SMP-30/gluconolactonase/LRE family protein [Methylobacterium sp. J-026]|uniref:SMP-30/gluconolactonase/LRE family protein n=1 Tax=Methylobacterium sp. J-026 TaxID=2836624 RepID=UPI001FB9E183|nr:SMP-30/gluconolactonase/LRE family protein [Methylobacterium sp. J-026]MCJ2134150.1 SMP-30/gluconolactonase/LRE family protein [Methylobacterium sp. J-026]
MPELLRHAGAPHPVPHVDAPRAGDPRFAAVVPHDARLISLYDQATFSEGPVWWPARQLLVWSDVEGRRVLGWREDGRVEVVVDATPFINGHTIDRDGALIHCEHGTRRLSRTMPDGRYEVVVDAYGGKRFNSPDDVTCAADGALWFTDPGYGLVLPKQGALAEAELDHRSVYRFDPNTGAVSRMADLEQPNGLAFAPDERTLYVTDTSRSLGGGRHTIFAFDVAHDHALTNRRVFAEIEPGIPDGLRTDSRSWVWTSSEAGIQVFSAEGHRLGLIPTPQVCSNLCFSPDERTLFVTSKQHLYALDLTGRAG